MAPLVQTIEGGTPLKKTITFDGGTTNAIGDFDGTGNPVTLFTVTGFVELKIYAVCTTSLTGASSTVEVGTSTNTAGLIAQTTATDIDVGEIWHDASPDSSVEPATVAPSELVNGNIILTVGTANTTAGVIDFYVVWRPISPDGNVVPA